MTRKPRIHLPGGLYHVILRGNGGQSVFLSEEDRYRLYVLFQEGTCRFGYRVHAFLFHDQPHAPCRSGWQHAALSRHAESGVSLHPLDQ